MLHKSPVIGQRNNLECALKWYETEKYINLTHVSIQEEEIPESVKSLKEAPPSCSIRKASLQFSGTISVRLLGETDDQKRLFTSAKTSFLFRDLSAEELKSKFSPKLIPDGAHIYIILLVKDETEKNYFAQLRVVLNTDVGHPELLNKNENSQFLLAAGEFYTQNGRVVLSNNKSGAFHRQLKDIEQGYFVNKFLDPYYRNAEHKFFPASANDNPMYEELKKRGYSAVSAKSDVTENLSNQVEKMNLSGVGTFFSMEKLPEIRGDNNNELLRPKP